MACARRAMSASKRLVKAGMISAFASVTARAWAR
jgi:hypothetical protein